MDEEYTVIKNLKDLSECKGVLLNAFFHYDSIILLFDGRRIAEIEYHIDRDGERGLRIGSKPYIDNHLLFECGFISDEEYKKRAIQERDRAIKFIEDRERKELARLKAKYEPERKDEPLV